MTKPRVIDLLAADGPFAQDAEKLKLYGRFIGPWDIESSWLQPDGTWRTGKGEWHFDWILGGRGIQDVLLATGASGHQFGTTLRCYDNKIDAWHLAWMQPASGEFVNLIGRQVGDRVVGETVDSNPRQKWSFIDITPDSFRWLGEVSSDNGKTWVLEQEMKAVRRKTR